MKKVIRVVLTILSVLGIFSLTGCGKKEEGPKVMEFIVSDDTLGGGAMKKMVEEYNSIQDEVRIQLMEYPYEDARTRARTMISAKQPPALMRVTGLDEFYGTMVDLSDVLDVNDYNRSSQENIVVDGKPMGAPLNLTVNGLLYNKTLFDQAGVSVPKTEDEIWTWKEFEEALRKVVENSDARFALAFDYSEHRWKTMMYQFGGGLFDENGNPDLNTPEIRAALEYFIHLHESGIIPEDMWLGGEDAGNLFKTGSIAALFSGSWRVLDFANSINSFEWGVTYMPKEKMRSTSLGGNFLVAFKGSKYETEAKDFIKWMMEDENYKKYCEYGNNIPAKFGVNPDYAVGKEAFDLFSKEGMEVSPRLINDESYISSYRSLSNILRREIVFALQGEKTVDEALTAAQKDFENNKIK